LRTVAGSPSAAPIMQATLEFVDAQKALVALSDCLLTHEDERQALSLIEAQLPSTKSNIDYLEFQYAAGIETIVRGALRTAAHQVLKEREPFGGKYSTRAIEEGIALVVRTAKGQPSRKRARRKPPVDLADEY